jgi:hypothetical protein
MVIKLFKLLFSNENRFFTVSYLINNLFDNVVFKDYFSVIKMLVLTVLGGVLI